MGILQMLERRRIRKAFGNYLSPELIEKLLHETGSEIKPPKMQHFQFVVAIADDTSSQEVPATVARILEIFVQHHANVSHATSALFVGVLGVPFPEHNSPEARHKLVASLLRHNAARVRLVHGECDGVVGLFGGPRRWTYAEVIPGFSAILKKLLEAEPGTALEIS
jgi:hypothetical protein